VIFTCENINETSILTTGMELTE